MKNPKTALTDEQIDERARTWAISEANDSLRFTRRELRGFARELLALEHPPALPATISDEQALALVEQKRLFVRKALMTTVELCRRVTGENINAMSKADASLYAAIDRLAAMIAVLGGGATDGKLDWQWETEGQDDPPWQGCKVPPAGWWCSREPGHEGPCAARPAQAETAEPSMLDVEALIAECVPGGSICDPQVIADSIRVWFAKQGAAIPSEAVRRDAERWQSIETAPESGRGERPRYFLGWNGHHVGVCVRWADEGYGETITDERDEIVRPELLNWMPIPSQPSTEPHRQEDAIVSEELKPCPFCSSTDISDSEVLSEGIRGAMTTQSACRTCGAVGPEANVPGTEIGYCDAIAREAWNRRATQKAALPVAPAETAEPMGRVLYGDEPIDDQSYTPIYYEKSSAPGAVRRDAKRWQHVKSGGIYELLFEGSQESDETPVCIYRSMNNGRVWVRPSATFYDGRFVKCPSTPPST